MNVKVFNRRQMTTLIWDKPYLLISVYGDGETIPTLPVDINRFCIVDVKCDDITEDLYDYVLFNKVHAKKILTVVDSLKKENLDILVHCSAGISRSSAIAGALLKVFTGDDFSIMNNCMYRPNTYIYRVMVDTAFELGLFS